jgi:hypothetical protein
VKNGLASWLVVGNLVRKKRVRRLAVTKVLDALLLLLKVDLAGN